MTELMPKSSEFPCEFFTTKKIKKKWNENEEKFSWQKSMLPKLSLLALTHAVLLSWKNRKSFKEEKINNKILN